MMKPQMQPTSVLTANTQKVLGRISARISKDAVIPEMARVEPMEISIPPISRTISIPTDNAMV